MNARSSGTTLSADRPFPGLRPFEFGDRDFFFGRRQHVLEMYGLLELSRFIAVIGSSGSGKSSLVRAGLLPLLEDEKTWKTVTLHPGDHPMAELTHALGELATRVESGDDDTHRSIRKRRIELALERSSFGISAALDEIPGLGDCSVLLLVDQFEELFRYTDTLWRDEASFFVQSLLEATRSAQRPIYVLITMRSDFIGDCARFNGLPEAVSAAQFLVPSLTRDQREEVIREPIKKANATIEPELVERLLNDIGPELDQLPVLSHCLARLWSRAQDRHLTLADYTRVGGISGALSKHANEVLASRSLSGLQGGVELVFRALSERDKEGRATRRALLFGRLLAETGLTREQLTRILDRFRADDCSFIIPSPSAVPELHEHTRIDVVHEALLRRWDKISAEDTGWLAKEEADGRFYRGLLAMLEGAAATATVTLPFDQVEERWRRWSEQPRTAAWGERYGGQFDRVEKLLVDSRAALAEHREAERRRIEAEEAQKRERLQLEAKLAQEQANAARSLAHRTRMLAAVMSVIAILAVGAALAAVVFGERSLAAEASARRAEANARTAEALAISERNVARQKTAEAQLAFAQARRAELQAIAAAKAARLQAEIARRESALAQSAENDAFRVATRAANVGHSLSLAGIDRGMYQTEYDNRVAGLIGTDAYAADPAGGARDVLLTAAWTPAALGRVALPPWSLGAVTNSGRTAVVLAGQRQRAYGAPVTGSLVAVDATTLSVLGRTPGISGRYLCGFDDASRVALAGGDGVTFYDIDGGGAAHAAARARTGPLRALACLPHDRIAYVTASGRVDVASPHGTVAIGSAPANADGLVVSRDGRLAAVTSSGGTVAVYDLAARRTLSEQRLLTQTADCSAVVGCSGAVGISPDDEQLAWYDAGAVHTAPARAPQTAAADASYPCAQRSCDAASLVYFAPGANLPSLVAAGGAIQYDSASKAYAVAYDDEAGAQRRPVLDPDFNMYLTPYDPSIASQPNPFDSGLATQSFSRIDGPMIGTIPASQWTGSYGLRDHDLVIPTATGYVAYDLDHLRRDFSRTSSVSYRVRMFDCGDGRHVVAFNMYTGDMEVLDIASGRPIVIHHFKLPGVSVKNGYYGYFVEPAYDPSTNIVTELSYSPSFATLRRFTADGRLLVTENRTQLLRNTGLQASQVLNYSLTTRGNYVTLKVREPAPDEIIRYDGTLVGRAYSIDYVNPKEQVSIATVQVHSATGSGLVYREAEFALPSWSLTAYLVIPANAERIAITADGRTMAYDDQEGDDNAYALHLYDLVAHTGYRVALPNPPDLLSSSSDTTGGFSGLTFTADGRYLVASYAATSDAQRIAIYSVDPGSWARSACLMAGRSLSPQEFREYVGPGIPYRDGCLPYVDQMYRW